MNTLYIHGLGSYPVPEKLRVLSKYGLAPYALHLDYEQETGVYRKLLHYGRENAVQFIAGSSLGGMLGFWLGEALGVPVLLFNPALDHPGMPVMTPEINDYRCPLRLVVIGAQDEVVNPARTQGFLDNAIHDKVKQKVITCSWLAHQIPLDTFEEMVSWAVTNLKLAGKW